MRIFIYGFKPFGTYAENVTEKVIANIAPRADLHTHILDVVFDEQQFIEAVDRASPDLIIGLGQCPRGEKLRLEQRAQNIKQDRVDGVAPERIHKSGPEYISVTFPVAPSSIARRSHNAGNYVCNFSMYVILEHLKERHVKFAFIHIPSDYDPICAAQFITNSLLCSPFSV